MGGGTIRTAAKVAGLAAATVHKHGSTISRRVSSVRASAAATDEVKLVASRTEADVDKPCLEVDDWVGVDDGIEADRVVFGGAPSFGEAKEATSELTEALDKAYLLSPTSVGYLGSSVADQESLSSLSNSSVQTKDCITSEVAVAPAVPAPAVMAFRLLHKSPAAQSVVASIVSDPNVWNAVQQNQELQEFLKSQKACWNPLPKDSTVELSSDSDHSEISSLLNTNKSELGESIPDGGFQNILHKIKTSVLDMMSGLSGFFNNLFSGGNGYSNNSNSDETADVSGDTVMETTFLGLAVMAILVIVLKRG